MAARPDGRLIWEFLREKRGGISFGIAGGIIDIFCLSMYNTGMKLYEHIREFDVRYCDVDFKDELKPSAMLAYFEEAACSSADELGFGYETLKPRGYTFMLTNIRCRIYRPVPLEEHVLVKTWPTPPSYVVFGREYKILSRTGEVFADATSRWCLVDLSTGKVLRSNVFPDQDYSTYNPARALDVNRWKLPQYSREEGEERFCLTIANSEYDHNMHVNNTRYADYCFNCFSLEELSKRKVEEFSLNYLRQCKEGDRLRFVRKRSENAFLVEGFNGEETAVQSEIVFAG